MANNSSSSGDNITSVSLNSNASHPNSNNQLEQRVTLGIDIIIFVVAVLGNCLVLVAIYSTRERRKTPFEILITNLSVADIFTVLLHFIIYNFSIAASKWYCKLVAPFFSSTQMVSMLIMTTIAIFRYRSIVHPFKTKPSTKLTCCTVLGLWIISNICLLPVYSAKGKMRRGCVERWPSKLLNKVYTVSLVVVQYVIPMTMMAVCYTRIVVYLKRHRGPQCGLNNTLKMKRRRDMEVIKISLIIVLLYNVSTLPGQIAWIRMVVFDSYNMFDAIAQFSSQLLLIHCCCNPFVYGTISREFRSRFVRVFWSIFSSVCKIRRTQTGVIHTEQGRENKVAEDLQMIEIKGYVKRREAAFVDVTTPIHPPVDQATKEPHPATI